MIEFRGTLSDICTSYMMKRETILKLSVMIPVGLLFALPFVIAAITSDWIFSIAAIAIFAIVVLAAGPAPKKSYPTIFPDQVIINGEDLSISGKGFSHERGLDQVKKVIDFGDWYQIIFFFPHKNLYFICQKDLLAQGSIEEFEKIFDGLIEPCK